MSSCMRDELQREGGSAIDQLLVHSKASWGQEERRAFFFPTGDVAFVSLINSKGYSLEKRLLVS